MLFYLHHFVSALKPISYDRTLSDIVGPCVASVAPVTQRIGID